MKLSVKDRLLVLQVLPDASDITTMRITRDLAKDLSFSEAEHKALKFKTGEDWSNGCPKCGELDTEKLSSKLDDDYGMPMANCQSCEHKGLMGVNQIGWNRNADNEKDIEIGDIGKQIIREQFEKLDQEGKIQASHLDVCELFGL